MSKILDLCILVKIEFICCHYATSINYFWLFLAKCFFVINKHKLKLMKTNFSFINKMYNFINA